MLVIVIDHVRSGIGFLSTISLQARVQISIEPREITAAHLQAQDVSLAKNIARCPKVNFEFINLAWIDEFRLVLRLAVPRSHDSFCQILGEAIRPHVYQFRGEIGVDRGRAGVKFKGDWSGDFEVIRECRRRVDQNVVAGFGWPLVARPWRQMLFIAT